MKKRRSLGTLVTVTVLGALIIANLIILLLNNLIGGQILRKTANEEIVSLTGQLAQNTDTMLTTEKAILETMATSPTFNGRVSLSD